MVDGCVCGARAIPHLDRPGEGARRRGASAERTLNNGQPIDLNAYARHVAAYTGQFKRMRIPRWEERFAADDDKVVVAYTFEGERADGAQARVAVMAVWRLREGKVASLHEVNAEL